MIKMHGDKQRVRESQSEGNRREELTHLNIYCWYSCFSPVLITCSPFLALSFSHTLYIKCARSVPFVTMLYKRPVNTTIMFNRELNTVLKGLWGSLRLLNNNNINIITTVFLPFRWRKKKEKQLEKFKKKYQRTVFFYQQQRKTECWNSFGVASN